METYTITINLTRSQMREIAAAYDLMCRTDDVIIEIERQVEDMFDEDGKPIDSEILTAKGITKQKYITLCNPEELAERFQDEYDWGMDGPSAMRDLVRDRMITVNANILGGE